MRKTTKIAFATSLLAVFAIAAAWTLSSTFRVECLRPLVYSGPEFVQYWAFGELGESGEPGMEALGSFVQDEEEDPDKRVYVLGLVSAWRESAAPALPAMMKAAGDGEDRVREKAIDALRNTGIASPEVVRTLAKALKDPVADVRERAAMALGTFGPRAAPATPALVEALADKDHRVRRLAIEALCKAAAGDERIREILRDGMKEEPNAFVREAARRAVEMWNKPEAAEPSQELQQKEETRPGRG